MKLMKMFAAKKFRPVLAFTMIEVAICLAIIGIALVGIIGILPRGLNAQRDNREETVISQDANMLIEIIRNGSHGQDDLTNYVYAITNYWTAYDNNGNITGTGYNGYNYLGATATKLSGALPLSFSILAPINSGSNIVSLLSTPEFMDFSTNGSPIPSMMDGGVSNHVVALVRSMSGLAAEKPPQDNAIMQGDAFTYRILAVNAPVALNYPFGWSALTNYDSGNQVYVDYKQWQWTGPSGLTPSPDTIQGSNWVRCNVFADQLAMSQREIRLKFLWPQLPNGKVGNNFQNIRMTVGGQLMSTNAGGLVLYYYQPQSFIALP